MAAKAFEVFPIIGLAIALAIIAIAIILINAGVNNTQNALSNFVSSAEKVGEKINK